ncbi:hypothetical protein D3C78_1643360 [compost metagenome]
MLQLPDGSLLLSDLAFQRVPTGMECYILRLLTAILQTDFRSVLFEYTGFRFPYQL